MWDHAAPFAYGSKPHILYCTRWVLVGPCCTICVREQATLLYCTGCERVEPCCTICVREHATLLPRPFVDPCHNEKASRTTATRTFRIPRGEHLLGGGTMLLHPLLSLVLLISYRDARITNSRKGMSLLPEKIMKTFSQITRILSLWPACEAARHGREGRRDARK